MARPPHSPRWHRWSRRAGMAALVLGSAYLGHRFLTNTERTREVSLPKRRIESTPIPSTSEKRKINPGREVVTPQRHEVKREPLSSRETQLIDSLKEKWDGMYVARVPERIEEDAFQYFFSTYANNVKAREEKWDVTRMSRAQILFYGFATRGEALEALYSYYRYRFYSHTKAREKTLSELDEFDDLQREK